MQICVVFSRKGFVSGEHGAFKVKINNEGTRRRVKKIKAELIQRVSYHVRSHRTQVDTVLAKEEREVSCHQWERKTFKTIFIRIPSCLPSRLGSGCRIINVFYNLKVS